jgi:hypothetical protein
MKQLTVFLLIIGVFALGLWLTRRQAQAAKRLQMSGRWARSEKPMHEARERSQWASYWG